MPVKRTVTAASVAAAAAVGLVAAAPVATAAVPGVVISKAVYDPSGTDTRSNSQLVREYVVLTNTARTTKTITGWTLRDKNGYVYRFGTTSIAPGKTLTVHTGKGTNSSTHRYWGRAWYVWNNTGDTAYLRSSTGALVDSCSWRDGNGVQAC